MTNEQQEVLRRLIRDAGPGGHVSLVKWESALLERLKKLAPGQYPTAKDGRRLFMVALKKGQYYRKWRPGGLLSRRQWRYELKEDTHGE